MNLSTGHMGCSLARSWALSKQQQPKAKVGSLRRDPFAMLPFCGYNMADYCGSLALICDRADATKLPKIFYVNWFRKDKDGKFLWPGYGENARVLEWVFERCEGKGQADTTPIGYLPAPGSINTEGLDVSSDDMAELLRVNNDEWRAELPQIREVLRGVWGSSSRIS